MIRMTPGSELKALDAMNSLRLCLTSATLDRELNTLDTMKNSRL